VKTSSAKQKGRLLQQWTVKQLLARYSQLTDKDLRSCSMGSHGEDVVMSQFAKKEIPFTFECKSLAKVAVYNYYEQCKKHGDGEPIVIIKQNNCKPLAVLDAEILFDLLLLLHEDDV
jgi:hypothetical protein